MSLRRSFRALFFAALMATASQTTRAMGVSPCEAPFLFPGARVNVIVLPYESPARFAAGEDLALLVQMNTLFALLKYQSVGAVKLFDPSEGRHPGVCAPDKKWRELSARARPGQGLVMVWGRIFEEGSDLYVQSFVRFARTGVAEDFAVTVADRTFRGGLSGEATAFPAQKLTRRDLETIGRLTTQNAQIRTQPDDNAPGRPVEGHRGDGSPTSYSVLDQRGDWAQVKGASGEPGWMKLQTGFGEISLPEKMPELLFIDGIAGYLQTRIIAAEHHEVPASTVAGAERALTRYAARAEHAAPAMAEVLALEMRAFLSRGVEQRIELLHQAVKLAPADARALNLLALTRLQLWKQGRSLSQNELADAFLAASVLDPDDRRPLANLKSLYDLIVNEAGPPLPEGDRMPRETAAERLKVVNSILGPPPGGK